jgi:hypothetical protein
MQRSFFDTSPPPSCWDLPHDDPRRADGPGLLDTVDLLSRLLE